MLSAAITYQVLRQENPPTIEKVRAVLEKHPWYANQWQARLQDVAVGDHGLVLFMQAARWPDDIRRTDKQYHRSAKRYPARLLLSSTSRTITPDPNRTSSGGAMQ
jgi:hypothetical protein